VAAEPEALRYSGVLTQGGWIMLRADPGSAVSLEGAEPVIAPRDGLVILGLDRDAPASAVVTLQTGGRTVRQSLAIAPVAYSIQRIDGLPMDQVEPSDPALLARIAAEGKLKQAALASRDPGEGFRTGFITPLARAVRTSAFGPQRILNGVPKTPHYGVDLAAPTGTPILAPADGLVVLAQPRMHFEGGLTLVDHGQGLVSMYLHQSRLDVSAGQRVKQGQTIGAVGATGRATGPHLCWRMTWRGRHMDPSLMIGARAPA
jgi:murein DD-endopeptidase MepM/ murein hydrolase activator NlpD